MPRGNGLALARERMEKPQEEPGAAGQGATPAEPAATAPIAARKRSNAGKLHIGGYYDPDDATIEAFRRLAFESRRSQQELLYEAIGALLAQQSGEATFGAKGRR